MRARSFIKTSINVAEMRITEGAWKKIVAQSVHLKEHCSKVESTFHLFYVLLFLTNLVFKFNIVLIGIFFFFLIMSITIHLLFCLNITDLEVYPVPLRFFLRNGKNLMRLGVPFLKVFSFKMI